MPIPSKTQSLVVSEGGQEVYRDIFVQSFAARLTPKGRTFIETWKSQSDELLGAL